MAIRRLLGGLVAVYVAVAVFTPLTYGTDLRTTAGALLGMLLMLALAVGVAWAQSRPDSCG